MKNLKIASFLVIGALCLVLAFFFLKGSKDFRTHYTMVPSTIGGYNTIDLLGFLAQMKQDYDTPKPTTQPVTTSSSTSVPKKTTTPVTAPAPQTVAPAPVSSTPPPAPVDLATVRSNFEVEYEIAHPRPDCFSNEGLASAGYYGSSNGFSYCLSSLGSYDVNETAWVNAQMLQYTN